MDIRKYVLMMGVGMILIGCVAGRSRSEGFLGRMAKGERIMAWEKKWRLEMPKELVPYWEVMDTIGDKLREEGYVCDHEYCMHDITGDGIPELWITSGFCELNKKQYVYTLKDNRPVKIFEDFGGHRAYYKSKNKVFREIFMASTGALASCEYDGKEIREYWIPYNYINDEGIQHADKPEDEERFQALRAECVDTNMLEFRELILR